MRNRKKQRELAERRRAREEMIDLCDFCGIRDPTPYLAVRDIVRRQDGEKIET